MSNYSLPLLDQIEFDAIVNYIYQASEVIPYRECTDYRGNIVGYTYQYRTVGEAIALPKERFTITPTQNPQFNPIPVTLTDYFCAVPADELSMEGVNFDVKERLAGVVAKAVARRCTQIIIDALQAGVTSSAITVIPANAQYMTYDKFITARKVLSYNSVPAADRHMALATSAYTDLLGIDQFTNNFYVDKGAVTKGEIPGNYDVGFKIIEVPSMPEGGLPATSPVDNVFTRTSFAWHKIALGFCMGDGIKSYITFENILNASWLINSIFRAAAIIVQPTGVVALNNLENTLADPLAP